MDFPVSAVVFVLKPQNLRTGELTRLQPGDPGFVSPRGFETRKDHRHPSPGDYGWRFTTISDNEHGLHGGLAKYVYVFIALCVLTGCSFFTYSSYWPWHDQPQVGWTFMMAVSCTKAMLVILFFMHVKYEANWKYVLTIPAGFMSIFLILMLVPDVGMRGRWASEEVHMYMAGAAIRTAARRSSRTRDRSGRPLEAAQESRHAAARHPVWSTRLRMAHKGRSRHAADPSGVVKP